MKTLTAFYDLAFGPVSYDFVTWLVRALKEQADRQFDGLHVVIVPNDGGLGGFSRHWGNHDEAAARWRLWHIVVAACPLAQATLTLASGKYMAFDLKDGLQSEFVWWPDGKQHFMGPLVQASRKGERIPRLQATEAARRYVDIWQGGNTDPIVTLTVREQSTDPARNSDLAAWEALRLHVEQAGCRPVWIDDTHVALGEGHGYAELDPDLRLALYERAKMNFIGNNGPQELLKFSAAPYRAFGQALSDGWKDHFRKHFALLPGEQLPWASAQQRLVYEPDSADVLIREFDQWKSVTGVTT